MSTAAGQAGDSEGAEDEGHRRPHDRQRRRHHRVRGLRSAAVRRGRRPRDPGRPLGVQVPAAPPSAGCTVCCGGRRHVDSARGPARATLCRGWAEGETSHHRRLTRTTSWARPPRCGRRHTRGDRAHDACHGGVTTDGTPRRGRLLTVCSHDDEQQRDHPHRDAHGRRHRADRAAQALRPGARRARRDPADRRRRDGGAARSERRRQVDHDRHAARPVGARRRLSAPSSA